MRIRERYVLTVSELFYTKGRKYILTDFLAADGYVHDERGELNLQLQERDKGHLEKLKKALQCEIPLMTIHCSHAGKPLTHYRFSIKCRKMVDALKQWNIVQNKSFILTPPTGIDEDLMRYWLFRW